MIVMSEPLAEGTKVTVENTKTQNKVEAKVVPPAADHRGRFAGARGVFDAVADVSGTSFFRPRSTRLDRKNPTVLRPKNEAAANFAAAVVSCSSILY